MTNDYLEQIKELIRHDPPFNYYDYRRNKNEDIIDYAVRICKTRDIYWKDVMYRTFPELQ